ncbi:MAG: ATP-binding protein [Syntrophales bacterium]
MSQSAIRVEARLDNLYALLEFVAACAKRHGAGEQRIREIDLVIEELLVNIFNYAYPGRSGDVEITCRSDEAGRFLVEIADQGVPFNILTRDDPDREAGIEERTVGGLGIFFVKRLVREIRYRREGERNILTLTVDPAPAAL